MICALYSVIAGLLQVYILVMLAYALVSWVPSLRGRWSDYIARLVEPVLVPIRRIIPPVGGLDISFLVVIILLQLIDSNIVQQQRYTACFY